MTDDRGIPAAVRARVFDAVQAELLDSGIDGFTIEGVARRAGVEPGVILAHWHDRRVLLMEVMLARTNAAMWRPDTGSLYTDLESVAALAAETSRTATGRALFRRVLPGGADVDLAEVGSDLWAARFRDAAQVLNRARDRKQLRDGIVPEEAIRMFAAAFFYDVIFTDSPVRADYAAQVVDIFLHGVTRPTGQDRPWPQVDQLLRHQPSADSGTGADQAVEAARRAVVLMRVWADALLDPVVLYEAVRDEQDRVVDFVCRDLNRAACDDAGLSRAELLGRSLLETVPNIESSGLIARYAHCLESGEPLVLNEFSFRHFDTDRWLDLRAAVAGVDLITVTWRDVGVRIASAQRDARYRQLMDRSAVPACLATPDGQLVSVNQAMADMLGHDMDTLLTMRWQDFTAPESLAQDMAVSDDILAGRRDTYRTITRYLHADGHQVLADLSVSCIRRPDGEVENLIAQMIDVTGYVDDPPVNR